MAPADRLLLSEVVAHRSHVLWNEAVAVVLELAEVVRQSETPNHVPPPSSVALLPDGALEVVALGPMSGAPVRQLRELLADLLEGNAAPQPLVDIAGGTSSRGPDADMNAFVATLGYFGRPNRSAELASLFRRVNAAQEMEPVEVKLAQLASKAREPHPKRREEGTKPQEHEPRRMDPRLRLALTLLALGVLGFLAYWFVPWRDVRALSGGLMSQARDLLGSSAPAEPVEAPGEVSGSNNGGRSRATAAGRSRQAASGAARRSPTGGPPPIGMSAAPPGAQTSEPVPVGASPELGERGRPVAPPPSGPSATPPGTDGPGEPVQVTSLRVYSNEDTGIDPPVLVSPQLPSEPPEGTAPDAVGFVDLIVNEQGLVDRVSLVSPANRFQERMLVWAAKGWRFRPALRDGVPEKYRTRVRVTL